MSSIENVIASNREAWNASASQHRASEAWTTLIAAVDRADFSCLDATLTGLLEQVDLRGKDVVQLGCNNGRESLSLFSLGARSVVGVDQSSAFLEQAHELSARSPHAPAFVEADIHALPASLNARFDVALITIGVLNWMPDMQAFFAHVASTLKPGGVLVIYETHPFLEMLEPGAADPWRISGSYFQTEPVVEDKAIVYVGEGEANGVTSYWHIHRLSDIVGGVLRAGLQLRDFTEYPHSNREDLYDVYEEGGVQVPMCYTLVAVKG
ncbi:Lovastatin nonaketide synthase [Pseudomonas reidholzensis]|uniref:Lovastatin nonaketide synthase n=1 Tax=Pseudomonas reidholzensis TaxID=1785162 RepID=A0A383RRD8_9PSED|nr:class I SAM-dependent methyltransferase [Pseudomonas reidholzensis]SYX89106.1 Lovastatin nonaketide synthase [Pseudomonas reidholzensis]